MPNSLRCSNSRWSWAYGTTPAPLTTSVSDKTTTTSAASGAPMSSVAGPAPAAISRARTVPLSRLSVATVGARRSGSSARTRSTLMPRSASVIRIVWTVKAIA